MPLSASMIFERSPSLYFAQSRSEAFIGNAGPEMPTQVLMFGNSSL